MSDIDFALLRSGAGGDPPSGLHTATLVRAAIANTSKGSMLVTEWQISTGTPYYWTAWHGFDGQRIGFTQEYLDGLGVDRSTITDDDALTAALADVTGNAYDVRVEVNGRFVNTYVEGAAQGIQEQLDVEIDTEGLPDVSNGDAPSETAASSTDQTIPF